MLKIDVIKFESLDVIATSIPVVSATETPETIDCKCWPSSCYSAYVNSTPLHPNCNAATHTCIY